MRFREPFKNKAKNKRGMLLAEALLAVAFSAGIFFLIGDTVISSQKLFVSARNRKVALQNMMPEINSILNEKEFDQALSVKWHGNDRVEAELISTSVPSLSFLIVGARLPDHLEYFAGTPLCTADFNFKGSVTAQFIPILVPSGIILTDLEVRSGYAYMTADSSKASDPDFLVADIKDSSNPRIISNISTGPGLQSLALSGVHIYAAALSTASQLHIINISDRQAPFLEKTYKLPTPYATATMPWASSVFYSGHETVYLGTEKWDGNEFNVIDISNPASPLFLGGLEIGGKVNDIFSRDFKVYAASADLGQIRTLNTNNPSHIEVESVLFPSGATRQEGKVANVFEDTSLAGRTSGGFNITKDHELFSNLKSIDEASGIYGVLADRNYVYTLSRGGAPHLALRSPNDLTIQSIIPLSGAPQTLTCEGSTLYVLSSSPPGIYVIHSS